MNFYLLLFSQDTCQLKGSSVLKTLISTCIEDLNSKSKDDNSYGFGWSRWNKSYLPPNGYQSIYEAFQYKDADSLQGIPIDVLYATYHGSGYVFELRGKLSYLQGNLSLLQQMEWIDRQTRAVFIEFSVYNPNINLIMVSTILIEFLHYGSILTTARFDSLNLFGETYESGFSFKIIVEILFVCFIVYYIIKEIIKLIKRDFVAYVKDFCCICKRFLELH